MTIPRIVYDKYSPFLKKNFNNKNNKPLIILYKSSTEVSKYIAQIVKSIEKIPTYKVLPNLIQKIFMKEVENKMQFYYFEDIT